MKNIDPMSDIYDEIMLYYQEYQSNIITDEVINNFLDEKFHFIIHAATDTDSKLHIEDNECTIYTIYYNNTNLHLHHNYKMYNNIFQVNNMNIYDIIIQHLDDLKRKYIQIIKCIYMKSIDYAIEECDVNEKLLVTIQTMKKYSSIYDIIVSTIINTPIQKYKYYFSLPINIILPKTLLLQPYIKHITNIYDNKY